MTEPRPPAGVTAPAPERLDSWKDIAAYLRRDVSTVQRWEKREGMPVHRHLHGKLGSVYAFPSELDEWTRSRRVPDSQRDEVPAVQETTAAPPKRSKAVFVVAAIVFLALLAGVAVMALRKDDSAASAPANPLGSARFVTLTDFEGREMAAAISPDGRFVAFLSDRDGRVDVWLSQVGSGQFRNLTEGRLRELVNPDIRMLGFSPDGMYVAIWVRRPPSRPSDISIWSIPTLGGEPRLLLEGGAELDWSRDGSRIVYHTPGPGDPTFIRDATGGEPRHLFTATAGNHNHYPIWSPDDAYVYYVSGPIGTHQDIWRIPASGGAPERMTRHQTRVSHPAFADPDTLLYLATDAEGGGPWLYALDLGRRTSRRVSFGVERYDSLDASADGRRLAVSMADSRRTLWRVPIGAEPADESAAEKIPLAVVGGRSPRAGPGYLLYVASRGDGESLWKFAGGSATELWNGAAAQIVGGPAIAPDGKRIAFAAEEKGVRRLYVVNADGSGLQPMSESLSVTGAPAWSPQGTSLVVPATQRGEPVLLTIRVADQKANVLRNEAAFDPVWSPDGASVLYSGAEVGTTFRVRASRLDGTLIPGRELVLSRGVRRVAFLPGRPNTIVVLRGDMVHKSFWAIDLDTGAERQLTDFGPDVLIGDFDVSPDGAAIVFDREQDTSDIVLIER